MATDSKDTITLKGLDFSNSLREIELDIRLWDKICNWHGSPIRADKWIKEQIQLFSSRHPESSELSQVISSIAFVEMVNPLCPRYPLSGRNNDAAQETDSSSHAITG